MPQDAFLGADIDGGFGHAYRSSPKRRRGTSGDALHSLANEVIFIYVDGSRYWFDTKATVTCVPDERARQLDLRRFGRG